ncbi:hypothetical protein Efla_006563 [Eimeria flavescens]
MEEDLPLPCDIRKIILLQAPMTTRAVLHDGCVRDMVGAKVGDGLVAREDDDTFHASKEEAEGLGSPLLYLGLPIVDMDYTEFFELYIERVALLYKASHGIRLKVCFERADGLRMLLRDLTTLTFSLLDIALAIDFRQEVNLYSVIIQEVGDGLVAREDDDTLHASKEVDLIVKALADQNDRTVLECFLQMASEQRHGTFSCVEVSTRPPHALRLWYDEDTFHASKEVDFIVKAKSSNSWLQNVAPDSRFAVHRHFALSGGRQEAEGLGSPLLYLGLPNVDMDYTEFLELYIERGALLLKVCFERADGLRMLLRDLTTLTFSLLDIALAIDFRQEWQSCLTGRTVLQAGQET